MPLRTVNLTDQKKFVDGDGWIVLRTGGLTKGESDRLRDLTAAFRMDPYAMANVDGDTAAMIEVNNRVAQANQALFEILCVEWSLRDPEDHPIAPTGEAYSTLDEESGRWVDECIAEVLEERRKRAEKNAGSSAKPRARGSSSRKAAG